MRPLPHELVDVWDYLAGEPHPFGPTSGSADTPGPVVEPVDAIVCLGSANLGTARRAAVLFDAGVADTVVVSGGAPWRSTSPTGGGYATEADAFTGELEALGVPPSAIVAERRATNTGENARFAVDALHTAGVPCRRLVAVCFPTLVRRAAATFSLLHPDVAVNTVPSFDTFGEFEGTPARAVHLVTAEVRRLLTYPGRGLIAAFAVPPWVVEATDRLAATSVGGDLQRQAGRHAGRPPAQRSGPAATGVGFPLSP